MIYLDTCALLKLVRAEPDTDALTAFIRRRGEARWFCSELAVAELARAVRRFNHDNPGQLEAELAHGMSLCDRLDLIPVSSRVLADAGAITDPHLRTLDAIHLASATGLRASLSAFVTYDKRLAAAAEAAGLRVAAPVG